MEQAGREDLLAWRLARDASLSAPNPDLASLVTSYLGDEGAALLGRLESFARVVVDVVEPAVESWNGATSCRPSAPSTGWQPGRGVEFHPATEAAAKPRGPRGCWPRSGTAGGPSNWRRVLPAVPRRRRRSCVPIGLHGGLRRALERRGDPSLQDRTCRDSPDGPRPPSADPSSSPRSREDRMSGANVAPAVLTAP